MLMSERVTNMEKKKQRIVMDTIWIFIIFLLIIIHQDLPLNLFHISYHEWPDIAIFGYCLFYDTVILLLILLGFKKGKEEFLRGMSVFLFYLLASTYQYLPLELFQIDYTKWPAEALLSYSLIYELSMILIIIWSYFKEIKEQFLNFITHFKDYLKEYIKYWFIALGLMMVSNLIIKPFTSDIAKNEEQVRVLIKALPIYTFIVSVIFAPLIEELIFRFSIRKISCYTKYFFIFLSGLVFGFMHVIGNATVWTDWLFLIPYSIPGWVFAYTLLKSDNIFVPISLHTIHNGILVTLQIITFFAK